ATTTATVTEVNDAPVADPNGPYSGTVGNAIAFDGAGSSDFDNLDGTIANDQTLSYTWSFGDGGTRSGVSPTHTYAVAATYTVTLVVNDGIVDSTAKETTATVSETSGITLSAPGYKLKGLHKADLVWSGPTSTNVDVYRDGSIIATTPNNGFYTDNIDQRGGGSYTYKVCQEGPSTCSNEATVTF
ncbi:MAG: PKD domain-containing protein, partial [Chloroflexi bacterium]|nr:PKD domain-containing protein [Chloroflexota bacterium]